MKSPQKRILVTGGCGYIGSHFLHQIASGNHPVVVVDNLCSGLATSLIDQQPLEICDFGDYAGMLNIFRSYDIEAIVHFAAHISVPESVANPLKYYSNNTANLVNLLSLCQEFSVKRFIFSSTAAVYGEVKECTPIEETASLSPANPYGRSKFMSEKILQDFAATNDMTYVIFRYFNVSGADSSGKIGQSSPNATNLVKVAAQVATAQRHEIEIFGTDFPTPDGTAIRDYVHVEDVATAHLLGLEYLRQNRESQILNIGYGTGYSVREVVNAASEIIGQAIPTKFSSRRPGDVAIAVASANRIKSVLHWQPKFNSLEQIVGSAIRWERCIIGQTHQRKAS